MGYAALLVILLAPYWLGPFVVWLSQKAGVQPVFQPFTPDRHAVPEDVTASFRQTCDALAREGFRVVADLFQTGQVPHVSTRVALLENPATAELALAVAMFTEARRTRIVASYVELPTKFRDGRTVTIHNSPRLGAFTPPKARVVVRLPMVRDPARLCRIKRAYLERHYGSAERVPFERQSEPARFLSEAMVRELTEQVERGAWRRDDRAGVFRPTFASAWAMTWQALPPLSVVRRRRLYARAHEILQELHMDGPDPRPVPQPRGRASRSRGSRSSPPRCSSSCALAPSGGAPHRASPPTSWCRPRSQTRFTRSSDSRPLRPRPSSESIRSGTRFAPKASP